MMVIPMRISTVLACLASPLFVSTATTAARNSAVARKHETRESCPGYNAQNIETTATGLTAELTLAGTPCEVYGKDVINLKLSVNYDSASRLHVKIQDADNTAYQVPNSVFPTPSTNESVSSDKSALEFSYEEVPFTFTVKRKSNDEVLFDTSAAPMIFEDQYLRLRTSLPQDPNLYGLGEHTDTFRLESSNYTRTLWSRDSYGIPNNTNLYGNHPIYFDHRGDNGTHGVFMLSSAGMDVKINDTDGQYLEYNMISGIIDLYFIDGPSPREVAKHYSEVTGKSAMMPYWGLGLNQCRHGYKDYVAVAEVVTNYSAAGIPLETMWTDIDYMYEKYIMTTDPDRFPIARVRELVDYLHDHDQRYVFMVNPAMAAQKERENGLPYDTYLRAIDQGVLLKKNNKPFEGVVWPGVTVFPDLFHPDTQQFWTNEFAGFFDASKGVDIDGLWIDMNEAANFNHFGDDPQENAEERKLPPSHPTLHSVPREIPGFRFQTDPNSPYPPNSLDHAPLWLAPATTSNEKRSCDVSARNLSEEQKRSINMERRQAECQSLIGFPDRNLLEPPYQIDNAVTISAYGGLSNLTLDTDIVHYDGHVELDVHNLYGAMMSSFSRNAMEARRPGLRPMVITRSTFAGSGRHVGKWLGDNLSTWELYRNSIQGALNFAAIFQMPMVGSDVCGFGDDTTETLCARWATLGAFNPFYRNHNSGSFIPQEFYLWPIVTAAAKNAIDIRYRLLDYIYTAMHKQSVDGTPTLNPMFFLYPSDANTFPVELQFFYGEQLLVSPVTEENSTSVEIYLPKDLFYDFYTYESVQGSGANVTLTDIGYDTIPLHIKSGSVLPMRNASAMTTTEVRTQPFNLLVAPNADGEASGALYLDDGVSISQASTSSITFTYAEQVLEIKGDFGYTAENARLYNVTVLGVESAPTAAFVSKQGEKEKAAPAISHDSSKKAVTIQVGKSLDGEISVTFNGTGPNQKHENFAAKSLAMSSAAVALGRLGALVTFLI